MQLKARKILVIVIGVLAIAGGWRYGYPAALAHIYSEVPSAWRMDFQHMTTEQIKGALGDPDEVASAKDFQSWLRVHWWGVEELKVLTPACCGPESVPSDAYYVIHVNGFYRPALIKQIH